MKKQLVSKIRKDQTFKGELIRAHLMIVLLSLGLILMITLNVLGVSVIHPVLSAVTVGLLVLVAIVSVTVIWRLSRK